MSTTLLLVDDDAAVVSALSDVLTCEGYDVLSACNGAHALAVFRHQTVDAVLLDLNLPVINGWDTFERLTAMAPLVPIIIITGRSEQRAIAEAAGAAALLEKPLDIPELLGTLRAVTAESAAQRLERLVDLRPLKPIRAAHAPLTGSEVL
jgi:DNA-binding response OmpR family regulator